MPSVTRSQTSSLHRPYDKVECVGQIKKLLCDVDSARGHDARVQATQRIFEYLAQNRAFVFEHDKFKKTILLKLGEFLIMHSQRNVELLVCKAARDIFCMSQNELIEEVCRMQANGEIESSLRFMFTPSRIDYLRTKMTE